MSEGIKRMLVDRQRAETARGKGLKNELYRRLVEVRKASFVAAFDRHARYHRAVAGQGPKVSIDTAVVCEAAILAMDPGWDAERAWNFSECRQAALAEAQGELERRGGE